MKTLLPLAVVATLFVTGCASCPSGSAGFNRDSIRITSEPSGANVAVYDASGLSVFEGRTPANAQLLRYQSYLVTQTYRVVFDKPGFRSTETWLASTPAGWYHGDFSERSPWAYGLVEPPLDVKYERVRKALHRTLISSDTNLTPRDYSVLEKVENQ
jgi:hypothetical protein